MLLIEPIYPPLQLRLQRRAHDTPRRFDSLLLQRERIVGLRVLAAITGKLGHSSQKSSVRHVA